jgi:hypothetical protein
MKVISTPKKLNFTIFGDKKAKSSQDHGGAVP